MKKFLTVLAYGHGYRLAQAELPDLEAKLAHASADDQAALTPARTMYLRGQLTLPGYAALLWDRLEAREPVEAYTAVVSGHPCVWDGVQRLELVQWNTLSADRWADWADMPATDGGDDGDGERDAAALVTARRQATEGQAGR